MHVIFYVCEEQISVLNVHIVSIIVTLSVCVGGGNQVQTNLRNSSNT